ncbi:MAG: hypothetical protein J6X53_05605 [Abditibacteriota bacterium]|nr:hypothetical protein [Abditibacteriota bacterium]
MSNRGHFEEADTWEQPDSDIDYGYDSFMYSELLETALEDEAADSLNALLYRDEQIYLNESPRKKRLKRELQREALERMESLARTEDDFREILRQWDRLQENSDRRFRNHVSVRGDVPLEFGMAEYGYKFPFYLNTVYWELQLAGRYLDILFDCPFDIDEVTSVESVSVVLRGLKNEYKELLNYLVIRRYSTKQVGEMFNQSDRNIRKKMQRLLSRIQREILLYIKEKLKREEKICAWEYQFLRGYYNGDVNRIM